MEHNEEERSAAIRIALEANVLEQCKDHDQCIYAGSEEIQSAYKLGGYKFTSGQLGRVFKNQVEMKNIIKEVVEDHSGYECSACAKENQDD